MAVHIRLRRIGKRPKKKPHFRITVSDERRARDGRILEEVGFYEPITGKFQMDSERISYWVSKGAQLSPTVKSLVKKSKKGA